MAEQPAPCPEEAAPYNNPEPPTVSALAEGVPPMGGVAATGRSLCGFLGRSIAERRGWKRGSLWEGNAHLPESPVPPRNGCGFFPPPSKRGQLENVPCAVSDPNLTSCLYYYKQKWVSLCVIYFFDCMFRLESCVPRATQLRVVSKRCFLG